jgi:hypothetical protein
MKTTWTKSRWTKAELDKQLVEFLLSSPDGVWSGIGRFSARENDRGQIAVEILVGKHHGYPTVTEWVHYSLNQLSVDRIEKHRRQSTAAFRLKA